MLSGTDSVQLQERMFALWSALSKSVWDSDESLGPEPWESMHEKVQAAWDALTQPNNLEGLELWASGDLNPAAREAADRALQECRSRTRDPA